MAEAPVRTVPRMRTISKAVAEIKALDPGSEVSEYWLRGAVRDGSLPTVWAGTKALVNLDEVLTLLRTGTPKAVSEPETVGGIRRIGVKTR